MFKITIITCTNNSEEFIERTLQSIYSQNFRDFEHIIIDNLSTDNTKRIIQKYSFKNQVLISEKDNGIYDAFNKGIQKSSGEIIGFLHSSDFYHDNKYLSNVTEKFEKTNCEILYTSLCQFNSNKNKINIKRKWKADVFKKYKLSLGWMPPHCATFIKKNTIWINYTAPNTKLHLTMNGY